jgi:hypothetical protein
MATDKRRTAYLASHGYRVLRFWNNEVLKEIEGVMTLIYEAVHQQVLATADVDEKKVPPTPDPSPPLASLAGGGEPRGLCGREKPRGRRGGPGAAT